MERLVIEAGPNTFTLDLHRRLTVVAGMGPIERESLIGELIGSLAGTRPGVHLEVEDDRGRHLAVFRPEGARDRIVDVDTVQDVSNEHRTSDGRLDLLARAGLDARTARRAMRLTAADLASGSDSDSTIDGLAVVDQGRLWDTANRLRIAEDQLTFEAEAVGSAPEDAEIIDRVERHHTELELAVDRREAMRRWTVVLGGISAIAAVPVAKVAGIMATPLLAIAVTMALFSIWCRLRISRAAAAEERALAEAGAQSYLGFHLQRVNGLLANDAHRKRVMQAAEERRLAVTAWQRVAGDVPVDWALEHRDQILAAARLRAVGATSGQYADGGPAVLRDHGNDLAQALATRLAEVRDATTRGMGLPLVLDDPFRDIEPSSKPLLLELLSGATGAQLVYLTEDEDVASWARLEALTGELAIVEPAPQANDTAAERASRRSRSVA